MNWPWATAGGLAMAPIGAIAGLALAYILLLLGGVSEHEGRRGMLAAAYGLLPGAMAGFWAGFTIVEWSMTWHVVWRATAAGCALGLLLAVVVGTAGLNAGIHLAEARGISNYAGERAAWSLFYVAFPLALAGAVCGFLVGRYAAS